MKKIGILLLLTIFISGCSKSPESSDIPDVSSGSVSTAEIMEITKETDSSINKMKDKAAELFGVEKTEKVEFTGMFYENKKGNFSIIIGTNRGFQENIGNSLVVLVREGLSGHKATISISQLELPSEEETSLEEYYNDNKLSIRDSIVDFTEISQKKIKIDGYKALEVVYDGEQNNQKFQIKQIFFQKAEKMFIITYLASQEVFSLYLSEADSIMDSINLN